VFRTSERQVRTERGEGNEQGRQKHPQFHLIGHVRPVAGAAVHNIATDGSGCAAIGTWDAGTTTCTLTTDITVSPGEYGIEVTGDNVTIQGAGHTITGGYSGISDGSNGVYVNGQVNVGVLNLNVRNFEVGIRYFGSSTGRIYGTDIRGCAYAVYLTQGSAGNAVFLNSLVDNVSTGAHVWNSNSNYFAVNNFVNNPTQAWVGGTSTGNSFTWGGVYGNYWDDWDSRSAPENCVNNTPFDGSCVTPYNFTGGTDTSPLVLRGGVARHDWSWYDNVGGDNWVLAASRPGSYTGVMFDLMVGGTPQGLAAAGDAGPGYVPEGSALYSKYSGLRDGPVTAFVRGEDTWTVASQRTLWPKGGNSLEEVPGVMVMDQQLVWPWYDMQSSGYKNWILVSNPNSYPVHYSITIGNSVKVADSIIAAGDSVNWQFPGESGGPVRVTAWDDYGDPVYIMASQRVLTNNDTAFNEVPGIPRSSLSGDNVWTWYDQMSPGAKNWVLIANPTLAADIIAYDVYYKIYIAGGEVDSGGPIAPGSSVAQAFPGTMDGPVEVRTYSDPGFATPVPAITSQRSIWGPSFEEVPGADKGSLTHSIDWTWYDQKSPGVKNWVLVANPSAAETITATVTFSDVFWGPQMMSSDIAPGGRWTPAFNNRMGGPVHVQAVVQGGDWGVYGDRREVIATQRVLWNGYFNEVWGQ